VFIGVGLGDALARSRYGVLAPLQRAPAWLQWLGRHSLVVYLLHQPLFLAVLWLFLGH
jgi:uncharacterized membrane protein